MSVFFPLEIVLYMAEFLDPREQYALLRAYPMLARQLTFRHLMVGTGQTWTLLHVLAEKGEEELMRALLPLVLHHDNRDSPTTATLGPRYSLLAHPRPQPTEKQIHLDPLMLNGSGLLETAALKGNEAIVELLLQHNIDSDGCSALDTAVIEGYAGVVRLLLDHHNKPEWLSHDLLLRAAEYGCESIVRMLLDAKEWDSRPQGRNRPGARVLCAAVSKGHEAVVKLLLERGLDVNLTDWNSGLTPLALAVQTENEEMVKLLLSQQGIDADFDSFERTPLGWAAYTGSTSIIKLLLARTDVNIHAVDKFGHSIIQQAVTQGHVEAVRVLLEAEDEANSESDYYWTTLHLAATHGQEAIVKLLLNRPEISVNSANDGGDTALMAAARNNHEQVVKLLLDFPDTAVDAKDANGWTALSSAAAGGHVVIVRLFLQQADLNTRHEDGTTPLFLAVESRREEVVKVFLDQDDIEANTRDEKGSTPLLSAARLNLPRVVELLLGRVDANAKDSEGNTALRLAAKCQFGEVVDLLLEREDVMADLRDRFGSEKVALAVTGSGRERARKVSDLMFPSNSPQMDFSEYWS